jgi:hypothetical protein
VHSPRSLTLVFEYAEKDLKDYMTAQKQLLLREPFVTKVRIFIFNCPVEALPWVHTLHCVS